MSRAVIPLVISTRATCALPVGRFRCHRLRVTTALTEADANAATAATVKAVRRQLDCVPITIRAVAGTGDGIGRPVSEAQKMPDREQRERETDGNRGVGLCQVYPVRQRGVPLASGLSEKAHEEVVHRWVQRYGSR